MVAKWLVEALTDLMRYKHDKNSEEKTEKKAKRARKEKKALFGPHLLSLLEKDFFLFLPSGGKRKSSKAFFRGKREIRESERSN